MRKLQSLVRNLYNTFVTGKEKAVAVAVVAFVVSFVAQHFGVHVSDGLQQTVVSLVLAALSHVTVYFTSNTSRG